jgi:23S rRNA (uracil1939-C5)-methyltransferase
VAAQRAARTASLRAALGPAGAALPEPRWIDVPGGALRDRADLAVAPEPSGPPRVGLGARDDGRRVVDLAACAVQSPALAAWMRDFRRDPPRLAGLAHARLRVGPGGARGVWLELSAADATALLAAGDWLGRQAAAGVRVSLGQRRETAVGGAAGAWGLGPPVLEPWMHTRGPAGPAPLFLPVGGFSQAGHTTNAALVGAVEAACAVAPGERWVEIGAGCGNFTLPLAAGGAHVDAVEPDPLARAGLERAVGAAGLGAAVRARAGSLEHAAALAALLDGAAGLLADPPRAGLGARLPAVLAGLARPPARLVLVSCAAGALARDLPALGEAGYVLGEIAAVDAFPHSPHAEWITVWASSR